MNRLFLFTFYCQHLTVDKKKEEKENKAKKK